MNTYTGSRKWAPQYPRLAYATGTTRCDAKATLTPSGAWLSCVKPSGHDGLHLKDICTAQLKGEAEVAADKAAQAAADAELRAALVAAAEQAERRAARMAALVARPEGDRYMEAIYGGRLMTLYPLGSVKDAAAARQADRLAIRHARAAGRLAELLEANGF
jgi:hypothetical protein